LWHVPSGFPFETDVAIGYPDASGAVGRLFRSVRRPAPRQHRATKEHAMAKGGKTPAPTLPTGGIKAPPTAPITKNK
jgi:hypothetical protein